MINKMFTVLCKVPAFGFGWKKREAEVSDLTKKKHFCINDIKLEEDDDDCSNIKSNL